MSPDARPAAPWRWPREIKVRGARGGHAALFARAVGCKKCLCSPCTPGLPAVGIPRSRVPAGRNRGKRETGFMLHANVNLDKPRPGTPGRPSGPVASITWITNRCLLLPSTDLRAQQLARARGLSGNSMAGRQINLRALRTSPWWIGAVERCACSRLAGRFSRQLQEWCAARPCGTAVTRRSVPHPAALRIHAKAAPERHAVPYCRDRTGRAGSLRSGAGRDGRCCSQRGA